MTFASMAGPTRLPEDAITRPWPNRFSISREGLEYLVHALRRRETGEVEQLTEDLLEALEQPAPY